MKQTFGSLVLITHGSLIFIAASFNKTVSYEKLYLEEYQDLAEVEAGLRDWMSRIYNGGRLHSSLGYQSPEEFEQNWLAHKALASGLVKG